MFGNRRRQSMVLVLQDAKALLELPHNDFGWSSWHNAAQALSEINGYITQLNNGQWPDKTTLKVLFAATGPIQEVSLSSGWSQEFLKLAERFDNVV